MEKWGEPDVFSHVTDIMICVLEMSVAEETVKFSLPLPSLFTLQYYRKMKTTITQAWEMKLCWFQASECRYGIVLDLNS